MSRRRFQANAALTATWKRLLDCVATIQGEPLSGFLSRVGLREARRAVL